MYYWGPLEILDAIGVARIKYHYSSTNVGLGLIPGTLVSVISKSDDGLVLNWEVSRLLLGNLTVVQPMVGDC